MNSLPPFQLPEYPLEISWLWARSTCLNHPFNPRSDLFPDRSQDRVEKRTGIYIVLTNLADKFIAYFNFCYRIITFYYHISIYFVWFAISIPPNCSQSINMITAEVVRFGFHIPKIVKLLFIFFPEATFLFRRYSLSISSNSRLYCCSISSNRFSISSFKSMPWFW